MYGSTTRSARSVYRSLLPAAGTSITQILRLYDLTHYTRFASWATSNTILKHHSSAPTSSTPSPTPTSTPSSTPSHTPSPSSTPGPTHSRKKKHFDPPPIRFLFEEIQEKMEGILHEWVEERERNKQQELVKEAGYVLGAEEDRAKDHIRKARSTSTRPRGKFELRPIIEPTPTLTQKSWLAKRLERLKHVLQRDQVPLRQMTRMVGNEMIRIDKMVIKKQPACPEPPAEPSKLYELFASHLKDHFTIKLNMEGEERRKLFHWLPFHSLTMPLYLSHLKGPQYYSGKSRDWHGLDFHLL